MHAASGSSVNLRFALPAEPLRPFVTTYYCTDAVCSPREPWLEDYLHPEWGNLRFLSQTEAHSVIGPGELQRCPRLTVTGPTSRAARFRLGSGRSWGIGLLPAGWASLFSVQAGDYADRFVDGLSDPAFAALAPLSHALATSGGDHASELALIEAHMATLFARAQPVDPAIAALTAALLDPELVSVAELVERLRHEHSFARTAVAARLRVSAQTADPPPAVPAQPCTLHARPLAQMARRARLSLS